MYSIVDLIWNDSFGYLRKCDVKCQIYAISHKAVLKTSLRIVISSASDCRLCHNEVQM